MFDGGVPEQIHRFIASPPPPPLPPHQPTGERSLPFPVSLASFTTNHEAHHMLNHKINVHHHHIKDGVVATSEWMDHDGSHNHRPWCSDEVLALLRFRSTVENWFPEFTNWEHTSRKLAEVGFKRSPQECKEKFEEEERRYFNSNNNTNNDHMSIHSNKGNHRIFGEVEEFYDDEHCDNQINKRNNSLEGNQNVQVLLEAKSDQDQFQVEEASKEDNVGNVEEDAKSSSSPSLMMITRDKKKRKRKKGKFGMLKGFCERLVRNMIAQQEEMHKKLLEDMAKKEEATMEREEAWKKQEMERLNKEIEIRAREQAIASDRNTNIIKFISKFTDHDDDRDKVQTSSMVLPQTQSNRNFQTSPLSSQTLTPHNPLTTLQAISPKTLKTKAPNPKPQKSEEKTDLGKRWPRDEVMALINIRCSISNMNHPDQDDDHKEEGMSKSVPLWERISKKMLESGYKRSAKRCKEKWENINKYFRKTKDVNKKRPLDSRTCPYFHQLTALYTQPSSTGTTTQPDRIRVGSEDPHIHVDVDDAAHKTNVEFSGFDLEF